ncbi:TetR/AcrR family transcriptional regulator [Kutzneria sp. CA-103260]|uniref:TetR/AcrR family transcriptional regulator n=1 Tax=Kutzneria sp. CA-103260 TaxID=2802641 RepID=UPI001BA69DB7|nr:TetR/AcrR family transcriptional regulator [Kutzneria sp. CA-103260]QUQ68148.1 TetR/AcrR family transcriptional regulator [Kutzneria sp. CA-103260]
MSTEDRQEAIAVAAIPLLAEHGTHVTTGQIAKAAGIAEGTIFRVFKDKQELLDFCVLRAFRTRELVERMSTIPVDQPMRERLIEAMTMLDDMAARLGALMHTLGATGYRPDEANHAKDPESGEQGKPPMMEEFEQTTTAIARLLSTGQEQLRLPADRAAGYLMGLIFMTRMQAVRTARTEEKEPESFVSEIVDLFMNGAIANEAEQGGKDPR